MLGALEFDAARLLRAHHRRQRHGFFYVDALTGRTLFSDGLSRAVGALISLHGLEFLHPLSPAPGVRLVMLLLAITGTFMTLTGLFILLQQFQRWWRREQAPVAR